MKTHFYLYPLFFLLPFTSFSQEGIKVFLDCQSYRLDCFEDYLRSEISFVEFVRDRKIAQIHLLPTYQNTASNGVRVSLIVIGQENFKAKNDTLTFVKELNETDIEYRLKLLNYVKAALIPYLAKTNQLDLVSILPVKTAKDSSATLRKESEKKDPWNYWVFNTNIGSFGNGDKNYTQIYLDGGISASRTTEKLKVSFSINSNLFTNKYNYEENGVEKSSVNTQKNYSFSSNIIKSITNHWSYGAFFEATSSLFQNYRFQLYPSTGIEYNILPYSKYNEKYVVFRYFLGLQANSYYKPTIYDKQKETVLNHRVGVYSNFVQKWGNIFSSMTWQNLLNDFKKNGLDIGISTSIRITKGLTLSFDTNYSSIHNQINLEKGDASFEDILIRRRQLATSFNFYSGVNLSYTFGSIYNNVVNPRF
jgi:hypothetical protein